MADTVQYLLEESIPELEDYEARGYFTKAELRQIIQKRQDFEYRLKRRAAMKVDYYRYIEYESKLEELRKHRKKKLPGLKGKQSIADSAIIKRLHFIYERATRKFKSDLQLWMDWLMFCRKTKGNKQHSKVVTRALQRHATSPVLWIEAANWEFEHNGNVAAARSLMQQGLRMCKHEEVMWVELLRLELLYIQRLRVRREVLGLDVPSEAKAPKGDAADEDAESEAAVNAVLTGAVAGIVLRQAIAALPESLSLRQKIIVVLGDFAFPGTEALLDEAYASVERDFTNSEEALDLIARRPLGMTEVSASLEKATQGSVEGKAQPILSPEAHAAVISVFQKAVQAIPSARMFDLFSAYLESHLEAALQHIAVGGSGVALEGPSTTTANVGSKKRARGGPADKGVSSQSANDAAAAAGSELLSLYGQAHAAGCASADLYLRWVAWAGKLGQPKMEGAAARQACGRHPGCTKIWSCRLALDAARQPPAVPELLKTLGSALSAMPSVGGSAALGLWLQVLEGVLGGRCEADLKRLVDMLESEAFKSPSPSGRKEEGLGTVVAAFLRRIKESVGRPEALAFIRRFSRLTAPGEDFYLSAIDILEEPEEGGVSTIIQGPTSKRPIKGQPSPLRELFEAAVTSYGRHSPELWTRYALFETRHLGGGGGGIGAGSIYWRATKALDDPDTFVMMYKDRMSHSL